MKAHYLLIAAMLLGGCYSKDSLHKVYEQGILDGASYSFEYLKYPSIWHREQMHKWLGSDIIPHYNPRQFWDSVKKVHDSLELLYSADTTYMRVLSKIGDTTYQLYIQKNYGTINTQVIKMYPIGEGATRMERVPDSQ